MIEINGWTIHHDGYCWWATREGNEPHAATSYLQAASWASYNTEGAHHGAE